MSAFPRDTGNIKEWCDDYLGGGGDEEGVDHKLVVANGSHWSRPGRIVCPHSRSLHLFICRSLSNMFPVGFKITSRI